MAILGGQNDEVSLDLRVRSNKQVHKILVKTVAIPALRIKIVDVYACSPRFTPS
jgi:phage gp29-like protein